MINIDYLEYLPNRLTPVYSKNYYEEENYLKIKTVIFKYITPPHSNGPVRRYVGTLSTWVREYVSTWVRSVCGSWLVMWLSYPSSHGSTGSISPASCALILIQYKSFFSTCTILFIRSVTAYLSAYLSAYPFVYLFIYLSVYPTCLYL